MAISPLPRDVTHKDRKTGQNIPIGKVVDEVFVDLVGVHQKGDYRKVLQLIKTPEGKEVRLGYYLKEFGEPESKFRWGSQTTFQLRLEDFKELLERAKKKGIL